MKRSKKVILTALFLNAVAAACSSNAQTVTDTSNIQKNTNDSVLNFNDASKFQNDTTLPNVQETYIERRHPWYLRIFVRLGWYNYPYYSNNYSNNSRGSSVTHSNTTVFTPRSGTGGQVKTTHNASTSLAPRTKGFGNTMHSTSLSARS